MAGVTPAWMYFISVGSALDMILDDRHEQLPFWAKPEAIGFLGISKASKEIHKVVESFDEATLKENIEFTERYLLPPKDAVADFLRNHHNPERVSKRNVHFGLICMPSPEPSISP